MFSVEAHALRADLAVLMKLVAGEAPPAERARGGCEVAVAAFTARALRLQQAFAAARLRALLTDMELEAHDDAASLRGDIDALQREIDAKDALIVTHRARVLRWRAECDDVRATAESLSEVTMSEAPIERDGGEAASQPEQRDTAMDGDDCGASAEDDEDEAIDEFD